MALPTQQIFIDQAEQALGVSLPDWLRTRLLQENGGEIETDDDAWQLFSVLDTRDRKHATRSAINIVAETQTARQWAGFPEGAVAIAANGTGDLLVLIADAQSQLDPRPFLWLHDDTEQLEPADGLCCYSE